MNKQMTALLMGLALFLSQAVTAQEVDDIGPGVDTSAVADEEIAPGVDTSADEGERDVEDVQPAATTGYQSRAVDSLELGSSQIIGNQELPQVLYIVPWKSSDLGDLVGRPVNTLLDEVLAPADREVFIRQIEYYDDLHGATTDDES